MNRVKIWILAVILMSIAPWCALGQAEDKRYDGYKGPKVVWPTEAPDLNACAEQEYYEPANTALGKYFLASLAPATRIQEHDECVWMITAGNRWRWILRRSGTQVALDAEGRDMFDLGRSDGMQCANPRPVSIPIVPPEPVTQVEEPVPEPETVRLVIEPPPPYVVPPRPERPKVTIAIPHQPERRVEKERKKWPWVVAAIAGGAIVGGVFATRGGQQGSKPPVAVLGGKL